MTIGGHNYPHESVHVRRNNLCSGLRSDGLTIHKLVQEKQQNEISCDGGGVNVESSQVKPNNGLLLF